MVADVNEAAATATGDEIRRAGGRSHGSSLRRDGLGPGPGGRRSCAEGITADWTLSSTAPASWKSHLLEETPEAEWRQMLDVNLTGAFLVTKAALKTMREQGGGAIVHIASRMAIRVKEGHGAYAAAKAGILQLTQMAALEGAPHTIRVNCRLPWVRGFAHERGPGIRTTHSRGGTRSALLADPAPRGYRQGDAVSGL
ncbi:MAG: SDR family oxidoreductase [Anaerotruncus sp.]|nr:SDR family oxidoreductase [Anaerotruncus sp.]